MAGFAGVERWFFDGVGCGGEAMEADRIPGTIIVQPVREGLERSACHTSVLSVRLKFEREGCSKSIYSTAAHIRSLVSFDHFENKCHGTKKGRIESIAKVERVARMG